MRTLTRGGLMAICALAGAFAAWLALDGGIGVSWDGEAYLAAAVSIREAGGIPADWAAFPPLYPILLALWAPQAMLAGAALINVAALALSAALMGCLLPVTPTSLIAPVIVVASAAERLVHGYLLAEPVFILLVMVFAVGVTRRSLPMMAVAASLAALQRYVGLALIPAGIGALWLMGQRRQIVTFVLIAAVPCGLWMLRNLVTVGAPMGVRVEGLLSVQASIEAVIVTLVGWLPLLVAARLWMGDMPQPRPLAWALTLYCAGHIALVVYGAATTNLDAPSDRLLAPLFIPAMLLASARVRG